MALRQVHREGDRQHAFWECQCDCGNKIVVRKDSLESGHAKSCGCLLKEIGYIKHGYSHTRLYSVFHNMKDRCYNPNNHAYPLYGGRGIKICDEWLNDITKFIEWAYDNGYNDNKSKVEQSIDRINVDGDYEPSNCRWANKGVQNYNKRDTKRVFIQGKEMTLKEISDEFEIPITWVRTRYQRMKKGLITAEQLISKDKLINKPQQILLTVDGVTHNLTEWEKETGISRKTIANRYKKGARSYDEMFKKSR